MSIMPVIYVPKSQYTYNTNVLVPVIVNFLRAGAIFMLDWVTLRFVENAPLVVWVITGVISLAILAVLQAKDWLDFKGKWYFTSFIGVLLVAWAATVGYAFWAYYYSTERHALFPTADEIAAAIARNLPRAAAVGPVPNAAIAPPPVDRRKIPSTMTPQSGR